MQAYSDPKRANDPHALPDIEVFRSNYGECADCGAIVQSYDCKVGACIEDGRVTKLDQKGYFWWACFPGCLPDSEPNGPFATEAEALTNAQEECEDDDESEATNA